MRRILTIILLMVAVASYGQDAAEQMQSNMAMMRLPYSQIDQMALQSLQATVDEYKDVAGYSDYKAMVDKAIKDAELYQRCVMALDSPYDHQRIVALRTELIPLLGTENYFTEAQLAEMDETDIYLSRYKGSVEVFKSIINSINNDATVKAYREAAKKGTPSGAERRKFVEAISAYVYKPGTKQFNDRIAEYVMLIPYLRDRLVSYLNDTAQYPTNTSAIEAEIVSTKL